jgi:hypothetical protein
MQLRAMVEGMDIADRGEAKSLEFSGFFTPSSSRSETAGLLRNETSS